MPCYRQGRPLLLLFLILSTILLVLGAGCVSREFGVAAGDTIDSISRLHEAVRSGQIYWQNREDETNKSVDHLKRLARNDSEERIAEAARNYLFVVGIQRDTVAHEKKLLELAEGTTGPQLRSIKASLSKAYDEEGLQVDAAQTCGREASALLNGRGAAKSECEDKIQAWMKRTVDGHGRAADARRSPRVPTRGAD